MADVQHDVSDIQPVDIPLPMSNTHSMITVRLSDAQSASNVTLAEEQTTESSHTSVDSRPRSLSIISSKSSRSSRPPSDGSSSPVDWEELEKEEEQEPKDNATDESTALLLAQLDSINAALSADPKAAAPRKRERKNTRPPSVQQLKRLVDGPQPASLRYSMLPAPAMTELDFWAAVVQDYNQAVERLPTLTVNKIRAGIPPPLRGQVWPSIAGARDSTLHAEFQRLANEPSPYDGLIGKDVGRSFPNVEMFREKDGEGQIMLGRVLKAFSLYDEAIGYCQGLGFVVGPLLMHMSEPEAFCILVRLMEHYDLRSSYLPDLSGLHLRIYQFQQLLTRHLPALSAHLDQLNIEPLYVSQWFLSFFAATCPLPMLLRIYDVILSEGAAETLMRVALSLMQRNEQKLLSFTEFEDAMQFLLSRSLWDTYAQHADDMVQDFVSLTCLVSQESLKSLEQGFRQSQIITPQTSLKSAAVSLLGRFWTGASHTSTKSANLSLNIPASNALRKSSSGQSLTSTLNSIGTTNSDASTLATEISDDGPAKRAPSFTDQQGPSSSGDRDLHQQIEELLTALSHLQKQQVDITRDLQREREERAEDVTVARELLSRLRTQTEAIHELAGGDLSEDDSSTIELMDKAALQFNNSEGNRQSIMASKHQLRETAEDWRTKYDAECDRSRELQQQLSDHEAEHKELKEHLREARARIQDAHREKQRLERTVQDLRSRVSSVPDSPSSDLYTPVITPSVEFPELKMPPSKPGLREFKLGKSATDTVVRNSGVFSKRSSSLNAHAVATNANNTDQHGSNDALLLELVNAKTAEAVARQELEETKGKLDALRKILGGPTTSPITRVVSTSESPNSISPSTTPKEASKSVHAASASTGGGGFFSSWGRKG
ncbi:uncharacterized protein HMPREF1541_03093 [Cyphellophora europaea CBS 101466]|uniref:Rab-GAP TBC domain-containing protein n=1 Tax=Cyphellophora europaea (strain CBS 101466) TaxID=1220924 RepID=W2RZF1_CYPE1|nr:uncharacterized protein HMPREF1541_03093 [Cyphellophora europaea CBS 101466]ETN41158.1 hypothetical protein HMPREF1541_03093 [Cyphellophora europaea CBS 101466]